MIFDLISWELWLAFAGASFVLLIIPGPTIFLVLSYSLSHGKAAAVKSVVGVALGDFSALLMSCLGVGLLLQNSPDLFVFLKILGAAYLIFLGVKSWLKVPTIAMNDAATLEKKPGWSIAFHIFMVTALNPKGITFFLAFLPQFVDQARAIVPQLLVLGATFLILAVINAGGYVLLASQIGSHLQNPIAQSRLAKGAGLVLIATGIFMGLSGNF